MLPNLTIGVDNFKVEMESSVLIFTAYLEPAKTQSL